MKRILAAKGIHYFVTRFGPAWLRSMAFDEKYRRGHWNFSETDAALKDVVQQYLRGGDLLVLGCGGASVLDGLEANSVLGVDLSDEALRLASRYTSSKVSFQKADMVTFQCPKSYDVILFSESLYYAPAASREPLLRRLSEHLKPGGVLIVTLARPDHYPDILELIRSKYKPIADRKFPGSNRHLVVFR